MRMIQIMCSKTLLEKIANRASRWADVENTKNILKIPSEKVAASRANICGEWTRVWEKTRVENVKTELPKHTWKETIKDNMKRNLTLENAQTKYELVEVTLQSGGRS